MKWTLDGMEALLFRANLNGLYHNHERDPQRVAQYQALDPVFRDGMLMAALSTPYVYERSDWLDLLQEVTPRNRQTVLDRVVKRRLINEHLPPLWLGQVWSMCKSLNLKFRRRWESLLVAAVRISKEDYHQQCRWRYEDAKKAIKEYRETLEHKRAEAKNRKR